MRLLLALILSGFCSIGYANRIVLDSRAATALNTVALYPDTTFSKHTNISYKEGSLFEILEETHLEHEDDAQNQKFKWYKVKTKDHKTGWIFGDALAVIVPAQSVCEQLKNFHQRKVSLSSGFEDAIMWVAATNGRDNFHENDFLNPLYKEFYLVITNERGRSVHLKYGGISAMGKTDIHHIQTRDLTGDQVPDFILTTNSLPSGKLVENRNLEIFTIQAGTLVKIFEERLSLTYDDDIKSPALYKFVEITEDAIRVEYVDYLDCRKYSAGTKAPSLNKKAERCMEYVTYTYQWNKQKKMYTPFYKESRAPVKAGIKYYGVSLLNTPRSAASPVKAIQLQDRLKVILHCEKSILEDGVKKSRPYFLVSLPDGQTGYIPGHQLGFVKMQHASLLNQYYQNPPGQKNSWASNIEFLVINVDDNSAVLKK